MVKICVTFRKIDDFLHSFPLYMLQTFYNTNKIIPNEMYEDNSYFYLIYVLDVVPVELMKLKDAIGNTIYSSAYAGSFIKVPAEAQQHIWTYDENGNPVYTRTHVYTERQIYKHIKDYVKSDDRIKWLDEEGNDRIKWLDEEGKLIKVVKEKK